MINLFKKILDPIKGSEDLLKNNDLFWYSTVFAIIGWTLFIVMDTSIVIPISANIFQIISIIRIDVNAEKNENEEEALEDKEK